MAEEINKTYTSNSLYNDSTGVIAFAEQLKQELINWANYQHVTEELGQNRPDLQSELNNLFLSVYERFLTFLNDADASEEAINTWKEIENFLADYADDKTLASIVAELNNKIESRLTVPLESTTGSSTTSTMTQKAITETIDASKTFTTGEKVNTVGIDSEPTAGSKNLVESGSVYSNLEKKANAVFINLFDKNSNEIIENAFISNTGYVEYTQYKISHPIFVNAGTYACSVGASLGNNYYVAKTDNDGNFISGFKGTITDNKLVFSVDEDCYIRVNLGRSNIQTSNFMVCKLDNWPSTYVPYGQILFPEVKVKEENLEDNIISESKLQNESVSLEKIKSSDIDSEPEESSEKLVLSGGVAKQINTKVTGKSINLFDKNNVNILKNGFINSSGNIDNPSQYPNSKYASVPVKSNTVYAFYVIPFVELTTSYIYCRFLDSSNNVLHPLDVNGNELPFYTTPNCMLKSPSNAVTFEFTVYFDGSKYDVDVLDEIMVIETEVPPTEYIPYKIIVPKDSLPFNLDELQQKVNEIDEKADLIQVKNKNLFNPANCIRNKRMTYYNSSSTYPYIISGTNSLISGYIPIEGGETYYYHKGDVSSTGSSNKEQCFNFFDENFNPLYGINPATDEPYSNVAQSFDGAYKAPSNAKYACFCLIWYPADSEPQLKDYGFQLEKGNQYTGYEPYEVRNEVPYNELPKDLEGLSERVEVLEDEIGNDIISVKTSDKIGFFSNSFLEGYAMYGKHAIEKLMMFVDYIAYNYSKSGDDMIEECARLDKDEAYLGVCKPSEIGGLKYGIIMHQDNDGIVYSADHRSYYENAKHLGYSIMSIGGIPILSTEHDWQSNYLIFQRLCQDEGWKFADWGKIYNDIPIGQYDPMWYSHHPSTRSNWCQVHGFLPIIQALPKPFKSVKLFRLRSNIDSSVLKNLLYNTNLERAEIWKELHNGQVGIKSGQESKFDRYPEYQLQTYNDEYQNLIKNQNIVFGTHILADFTIPYNVRSVSMFKLTIVGTGIEHLYARQIRYMDNSWLPTSSSKFISFGVTSGENLLNIGDQITISGISRLDGQDLNMTYTISAISEGYIITTEPSGTHITSGTDTPVCNISGVTLAGSYDFPSGAYMDNYNKPLGQWTEIQFTSENNTIVVDLTPEQIEKFGVVDKFVFMGVGTNITISNIFANVIGNNLKDRCEKDIIIPKPVDGLSALTTTTFAPTDTDWQNIGNIPVVSPITDGTYTEQLPGDVIELSEGDYVAQALDTSKLVSKSYKESVRIQIQILARWFPKYILTDSEYATSELTPDSFDMAKLEVQLNTSALPANRYQCPVTTMYIGAWWNVYVFEMDLVGTPSYLTLKCVDKRVQLAKCDVVVLNPQN